MRIIVISDTHRDFRTLRKIAEKHMDEANLFLHLGDGERDVDDLLSLYPSLQMKVVRGNCDFASMLPEREVTLAGETRIFMAHGHTFGVNGSLEELTRCARQNNCKIALYGHTHRSDVRYDEGIYVMNPGSPSAPRDGRASYGIIDITPQGIMPFIVEI